MRLACALAMTGLVGLVGLTSCNHGASTAERPLAPAPNVGAAPPVDPAAVALAQDADALTAPRSEAALATWLAEYDRRVAANADPAAMARAREAVDHMAAQRDAHLSRLYWHTDLAEAQAEAARTNRPILSLRLLGRLDEELSCANSRLFRIILYSNQGTSKFLRDHYVLHWSSERPAPRVTLDFGDGRIVERTITGNSAHFVLDARGRVVDVLPGLYGPARFEKTLRETLELAKQTGANVDDEAAQKQIATHHRKMVWALTATWRKQLAKAYDASYPEYAVSASLPEPSRWTFADPLFASLPAAAVNALTFSKADTEAPTLALLQPEVTVSVDMGPWTKVAAGVPTEHLDAAAQGLLRAKHPRDWSTAEAPVLDDAKLTKALARFEARLTVEGFRNELMMHGAMHGRMSHTKQPMDFASLDRFLYANLFETPKDDGWLGLAPFGSITGLPEDGIVSR